MKGSRWGHRKEVWEKRRGQVSRKEGRIWHRMPCSRPDWNELSRLNGLELSGQDLQGTEGKVGSGGKVLDIKVLKHVEENWIPQPRFKQFVKEQPHWGQERTPSASRVWGKAINLARAWNLGNHIQKLTRWFSASNSAGPVPRDRGILHRLGVSDGSFELKHRHLSRHYTKEAVTGQWVQKNMFGKEW